MSKVLAFIASLAFAGFVSAAQPPLSKGDITQLAKKKAASYCARSTLGPYIKVGCTFTAIFDGQNWGVIVHSIFKNVHGKEAIVAGADVIYVFSPSGKLLRELHGY